jgi:hypothetical protein
MKTINELENELRSWRPCAPSPRLRAKIFGPPKAETGWGWNQTGLAFASVLGLALIIAIRQNPPTVAADGRADQPLLAAAMSNQDLAVYVSRQSDQDVNLPTAGFEATNLGHSLAVGELPRQTTTNR